MNDLAKEPVAPSVAAGRKSSSGWRLWLFFVAFPIALAMTIDGWLYAVLGIERAIRVIGRLFELTYPIVDGRAALPQLEWAPRVFRAHAAATYLHVLVSPIALAIGPLQLVPWLRKRGSALHRSLGKLYVAAVLIGIPAGVYLGAYEAEGIVATMGFVGMGVTTVVCTLLAYVAARAGDFESHRAFMLRSYLVMFFGNVVLRLAILLVIPRVAPMPAGYREPYLVCVFLSWPLGLLVADVYLYLSRARPARAGR